MPRHNPHLVPQFLSRHPSVDGYTLIAVLEHISRLVHASRESLLATALVDSNAAQSLVRTCLRFQNEGLT
jgi:hypothetical protein